MCTCMRAHKYDRLVYSSFDVFLTYNPNEAVFASVPDVVGGKLEQQ